MAARPATELDLDELARAHRPRTLCSTNPQTPINEDWDQTIGWSLAPKKPVAKLWWKEATTKKGTHSVNNILPHGRRPSKHFLGHFLLRIHHVPPLLKKQTATSSSLRLMLVSGICTSVGEHSCHRYMPFCQWRLFARKLPCASGPA